MNLAEVLNDYNKLALPGQAALKLAYVYININKDSITQTELINKIEALAPTMGWFTLPSRHEAFVGAFSVSDNPYMLTGEFFSKEKQTSLHLKYQGDGSWRCCEYSVSTDLSGKPANCLVEKRGYLCRDHILDPEYQKLNYQCCWMLPGKLDGPFDQGLRIRHACFIGFGS